MDISDYIQDLELMFFSGQDIAGNWIVLILMNMVAAGYIWLCFHTHSRRAPRRVIFPYFFMFVTIEGWLLGFLFTGSDWTVWLVLFQIFVTPLIFLVYGAGLSVVPEKSGYDYLALIVSFGYPALLVLLFAVGILKFGN